MKILITIILALSTILGISAQRYLPGQKGLQVTAGFTDGQMGNCHIGIALSKYTKSQNRWVYGAEFLNKQIPYRSIKIPVSQITGEAGYYNCFLSDSHKNFFFSLGLSGMTGYESINWGEQKLFDGALIENRGHFIYGGAATFEIETYFTDRLVLLLNVRQRLLWGSDVEKFHNQVGVGFKYIIN